MKALSCMTLVLVALFVSVLHGADRIVLYEHFTSPT